MRRQVRETSRGEEGGGNRYFRWPRAGLGEIAENTAAGDYPKIVLGIAVMSILVTLFNRLLWRPLYAYAEDRLRLD